MKTVAVVLGTRPEAIKLAPLIRELRAHCDALRTEVIFSGQHLHLVRPILEFFQIEVQRSLESMPCSTGWRAFAACRRLSLTATAMPRRVA